MFASGRGQTARSSLGDEWLEGVRAGPISRRKGRSKPYSPTTIADYTRAYRDLIRPERGPMPADEIGELEQLSAEALRVETIAAKGSRPRSVLRRIWVVQRGRG